MKLRQSNITVTKRKNNKQKTRSEATKILKGYNVCSSIY
jgi:hypothetical protein